MEYRSNGSRCRTIVSLNDKTHRVAGKVDRLVDGNIDPLILVRRLKEYRSLQLCGGAEYSENTKQQAFYEY